MRRACRCACRARRLERAPMAKATKKKNVLAPDRRAPKKTLKPKKLRKPGKRAARATTHVDPPRPAPPLAIGPAAVGLDGLWSVVMPRRTADPAVSHSARLL